MSNYELEVKVRLNIDLEASSYKDAVNQVNRWLIGEDIISDFDIIDIDAYTDADDED